MNSQVQNMRTKTIVITGASSRVGRAMALELARHGAKLLLAARRKDALQDLVLECNVLGGLALAVPADVRLVDNLRELAEKTFQFGDSIDVWINNAGVLAAGALEQMPSTVNEDVIRTNLISASCLQCTKSSAYRCAARPAKLQFDCPL